MTQTPTLTGRDIGQAEHATRAVLDGLLAETGTPFLEWIAMNLLGGRGGTLGLDTLAAEMAHGLKIDEADARAAVAALVAQNLASTAGEPARVELTATGEARRQRIQHGIDGITDRLYGNLPVDDLVTARRVLATITERANRELAR